jgi:general secretion pathway protein D
VSRVLPVRGTGSGHIAHRFDIPDPPPLGLVSQLVPLQSIRADESCHDACAIVSKGARIKPSRVQRC